MRRRVPSWLKVLWSWSGARVFLAVMLAGSAVLLASPVVNPGSVVGRLVSILLLLVIVLLYAPDAVRALSGARSYLRGSLACSLMIAAGFGVLSSLSVIGVVMVPVFLVGLWLLSPAGFRRQELAACTAGTLAYAVFSLFLYSVPFVWSAAQWAALEVSSGIGFLFGQPTRIGPTMSGLYVVVLSLMFLAFGLVLIPAHARMKRRWFLGCVGITLLVWVGWLVVLVAAFPAAEAFGWSFWVFVAGCLVAPAVLFVALGVGEEGFLVIRRPWLRANRRRIAVAALSLLLVGSSMLLLTLPPVSSTLLDKSVVVYAQHMVGTWDVPSYAAFGHAASGMFGLLPQYLSASGYNVTMLVGNRTAFLNQSGLLDVESWDPVRNFSTAVHLMEAPEVTMEALAGASVFVVVNVNASFSEQEQAVIWQYVRQGGGLLVVGDHTDAGGLQDPLNTLLKPAGIRFRFDAAIPYSELNTWDASPLLLGQPFGVWSADSYPWGVGASLDVSSPGFPVLVGAQAFADLGDRSSSDPSFLGDYRYEAGEQAGDVVLAAAAYVEKGRVVVWGDTSAAQNLMLPASYPAIDRLMGWLGGSGAGQNSWLSWVGAILLLGAAVVLVFFARPGLPLPAFAIAVAGGLVLSFGVSSAVSVPSTVSESTVLVDTSHGERFSTDAMRMTSVSGLMMNLERKSLLPLYSTDIPFDRANDAAFIVLVAPTKTLSAQEVKTLSGYMSDGGHVIVAAGYTEQAAVAPLLSTYGVTIQGVPLGPVPYLSGAENETLQQPRFVDSWPLSFDLSEARSFYNFTYAGETYHLVIYVPVGQGGLLVIADSQFLLDSNQESLVDYWPGNILFLKGILEENSGGIRG